MHKSFTNAAILFRFFPRTRFSEFELGEQSRKFSKLSRRLRASKMCDPAGHQKMSSNYKESDLAASFQNLQMDESSGKVNMIRTSTFENHSQRNHISSVVQHDLPLNSDTDRLEIKTQGVSSILGRDTYHIPPSQSQWNEGTGQDNVSAHQQTQRRSKAFTGYSSGFPGNPQKGVKYPNSKLHKAVTTHQDETLSQSLHSPTEGLGDVRRSKRLRDKAQNRNAAEAIQDEPASLDHFGAPSNRLGAFPRAQDKSLHYSREVSTSHHSTSNTFFGGLQQVHPLPPRPPTQIPNDHKREIHPLPPRPSTQIRNYHKRDLRGPKHSQGNQKIDDQNDESEIHPTQQLFEHLNLVAQQRGLHSVARPAIPSPKKKELPLRNIPDQVISSKPPTPTLKYVEQASRKLQSADKPQTLLIVLDINGTLVERIGRTTKFVSRPYLDMFRQYCLQNHRIMMWSSAMPKNVEGMCKKIFTPAEHVKLVAVWGRDKLNLKPHEYLEKVQVYKRLEGIWDDKSLQTSHPDYAKGGRWSQANTILIDDSVAKAAAQPFNHIEVPEFTKQEMRKERDDKVLASVIEYLEQARMWLDVSSFIAKHRFQMGVSSAKDLRAAGGALQG